MDKNWLLEELKKTASPNKVRVSDDLYEQILEVMKEGYTMTQIWDSLKSRGIINCKYDAFAQHIRRRKKKLRMGRD